MITLTAGFKAFGRVEEFVALVLVSAIGMANPKIPLLTVSGNA